MKKTKKFTAAFDYFKKSYKYKMGGTQTVILPNGHQHSFDDRDYYGGRNAALYNRDIRHDIIGEVKVSRKDYAAFLKIYKARLERLAIRNERILRIQEAKAKGIYSIDADNYVELSAEESTGLYFDAKRLAKTLDITVEDATLLHSEGKTYVFAKQKNSGKTIKLYHPSLSCNDLSIHISYPTAEEMNRFNHAEWVSAPFATQVGQTMNTNHFVC